MPSDIPNSVPSSASDQTLTRIAQGLANAIGPLLRHRLYPEFFRLWEEAGLHISRVGYYSPIPEIAKLPAETWQRRSDLAGIDMRDAAQLRLLTDVFPRFEAEYSQIPRQPTDEPAGYFFENGKFGGTDALVLYCMIRHFRPRRIIEVGSGFSSRLTARAALVNGDTKLTCVEPYPDEVLRDGFAGLDSLIARPVQEVGRELFEELSEGDILFIDSSHVAKIGSDVNYLFFEILPRLRPGVLVHVHDIFLPFDYRRTWVVDDLRFWTEQYLLQAFLTFNSEFEVVFANSYIEANYPNRFRETFPDSPWWGGGSFWMRRKTEQPPASP